MSSFRFFKTTVYFECVYLLEHFKWIWFESSNKEYVLVLAINYGGILEVELSPWKNRFSMDMSFTFVTKICNDFLHFSAENLLIVVQYFNDCVVQWLHIRPNWTATSFFGVSRVRILSRKYFFWVTLIKRHFYSEKV